ncbi:MAG TPA: DUF2834 domain-containing protein [Acidimicrobiales bacterium]|nr:DUF2834 domain-containing protein [Acidimicrobiales bacterium]
MFDTKVRSTVYLALAAVGLVATGYFNVQWLAGDFDHTVDGFLEAAFANSASSSLASDGLIAFAAACVFMLVEGGRLGMRSPWIYVALSFVTAFACTFPLFLWARERHLARHASLA